MSNSEAQPSVGSVIEPPAKIAIIGLGNMGRPMGARLIGAGFEVVGFDTAEPMREIFARDAGGKIASSLVAAVDGAQVVITMLPNGAIVREVLNTVRQHLRTDAIIVEMSSSDPIGTREIGEALVASGFGFLDAPVSGGVKRAIDGSLAIIAGGDSSTIDRIEPMLKAMGAVFRTGPIGSGHAVKALNNYVGCGARGRTRGHAGRQGVRRRARSTGRRAQRFDGQKQLDRGEAQAVCHLRTLRLWLLHRAYGEGYSHCTTSCRETWRAGTAG